MGPRKKKLLIASISIVLILVLVSVAHFRKSSILFNMIFTPSDWSVPLTAAKIDFDTNGQVYSFPIETKYPGLHWANISVAVPPKQGNMLVGDFELFIEVKDGDKLLDSRTFKPTWATFEGNIGGFPIYSFRSPERVPIRKKLNFRITVVKANPLFKKVHGQATLTVRKISDE